MKIYYDSNMPYVEQFFSEFGEIIPFNGRDVDAKTVSDADVLLVRSITEVNQQLLAENQGLTFVGTATIGKNHIDADYLARRNIPFFAAPGCNANAVSEYVLSALFTLAEKYQFNLLDKRIGIVGGGNTGTAVAQKLKALGVTIKITDPHLDSHHYAELVDVETLRSWADILCFHVPLIKSGEHPTWHLMAAETLATLRPEQMLINACRGEVFDNQALLAWKKAGAPNPVVLDVWENEPHILDALIDHVDIATVHIAGHSVLGKAKGTQILYERFCETIQVTPKYTLEQFIPNDDFHSVTINPIVIGKETTNTLKFNLNVIQKLMRLVYDVRRDDAILRTCIKQKGFDTLRKQYPVRYECNLMTIQSLTSLPERLAHTLQEIGFKVR